MMTNTFPTSKLERKHSLQSALTHKYCIRDTLLVEAIFVRMYPDSARDLVCLGISNDNFIMARVIVTGYDIDFELLSESPLCQLGMKISNDDVREIIVTGTCKAPQIFQMCTSAAADQLWPKFVKCLGEWTHAHKDTWVDVQLETVASAGGDPFGNSMNAEKEFNDAKDSHAVIDMAFTGDINAMDAEIEVKFDQFVNDASSNCHTLRDHVSSQDTHCSTQGWRGLWLFRKIFGRKKRTTQL